MIKPVLDNIAVRIPAKTNTTESGLFVGDALDDDKPGKGEVVAVGPGKVNEKTGKVDPLQVQVGDIVIFGKKAGVAIKTEDGPLQIMHEPEILAVLR